VRFLFCLFINSTLPACSCEKDQFLLRNLEYGTQTADMRGGHLMASQEAHAFKFADRVIVNFQCSIQLEIRGEDGCEVGSPGGIQSSLSLSTCFRTLHVFSFAFTFYPAITLAFFCSILSVLSASQIEWSHG